MEGSMIFLFLESLIHSHHMSCPLTTKGSYSVSWQLEPKKGRRTIRKDVLVNKDVLLWERTHCRGSSSILIKIYENM